LLSEHFLESDKAHGPDEEVVHVGSRIDQRERGSEAAAKELDRIVFGFGSDFPILGLVGQRPRKGSMIAIEIPAHP